MAPNNYCNNNYDAITYIIYIVQLHNVNIMVLIYFLYKMIFTYCICTFDDVFM